MYIWLQRKGRKCTENVKQVATTASYNIVVILEYSVCLQQAAAVQLNVWGWNFKISLKEQKWNFLIPSTFKLVVLKAAVVSKYLLLSRDSFNLCTEGSGHLY